MAEEETEMEEEEGVVGSESLDDEEENKKPPIVMIVGIVVILLLGGGAAAYFTGALDGLLGKDSGTEEHAEAGGHGDDGHGGGAEEHGGGGGHGGDDGHGGAATGPQFMEIPDLIVNLNSTSSQPRFLKLRVQIEVKNPQDLAAVQAVAPRVIDHFQTYLRELRVQDLKGSAGIYKLRQELVRRVNAAAYPVTIKDVLFQEILIQ